MKKQITSLKGRAESALKQMAKGVEGSDRAADSVIDNVRAALREVPGAGVFLGSFLGRLQAARKAQSGTLTIQWVSVGGGQIAVGHRPRIKAIKTFSRHGVTHILTLLSEKEGGAEIGAVIKKAGIGWSWFPLKSAAPPGEKRVQEVRLLYGELKQILATGGRIFVHCAAGIHRTGMITYGLLRSMGFTEDEAKATLHTLRPETGEGVGESRLAWGDRFG